MISNFPWSSVRLFKWHLMMQSRHTQSSSRPRFGYGLLRSQPHSFGQSKLRGQPAFEGWRKQTPTLEESCKSIATVTYTERYFLSDCFCHFFTIIVFLSPLSILNWLTCLLASYHKYPRQDIPRGIWTHTRVPEIGTGCNSRMKVFSHFRWVRAFSVSVSLIDRNKYEWSFGIHYSRLYKSLLLI